MKGAIIYIALLLGAAYFLIQHGVEESKKEHEINARIACQKEVFFSEKIHDKALVKEAKNLLYSKNFTLISSIEKSRYAKSKISEYLGSNEVDMVVKRIIEEISKDKSVKISPKKLTIEYQIVENDKDNPVKRDGIINFCIGYLDFKFILDDKLVYEAQNDFIGRTGEDIPRRIKCILNSFTSL